MADYYRQAVDAAVAELGKPLRDLDAEEQEDLVERVIDILVEWDVFSEDSRGIIRGGGRLREANQRAERFR